MNTDWEKELDELLFKVFGKRDNGEVKPFIESLLKEQRDEHNKIIQTVLGLLVAENKKLQTENSILKVVIRNLTSDLPEESKKEIEELIRV